MIETPPKSYDAARIRELEELWALPAKQESRRSRINAFAETVLPHLGKILGVAWIAFFVATAFAPAAEAEAATPLWAGVLIGGLFASLLVAIAFSAISGRVAFGAAAVAGGLGIALAVACKTTEHHASSWWAYELGATVLLTGLAMLCLKRVSRNS